MIDEIILDDVGSEVLDDAAEEVELAAIDLLDSDGDEIDELAEITEEDIEEDPYDPEEEAKCYDDCDEIEYTDDAGDFDPTCEDEIEYTVPDDDITEEEIYTSIDDYDDEEDD